MKAALYLAEGVEIASLNEAIPCPVCGHKSVLEGATWDDEDEDNDGDSIPWWYCVNEICWFETETEELLQP